MTTPQWLTLAIVLCAIVLFASEKVRIDIVALIVVVLLVVLDLVTPAQALAGFSNEATVTVAAMFALSLGIERSGALEPLARLLSRIRKPWLLTLALMLAIAPMGAFVKNIALVATFLPLALRVCANTGTSPVRVLLPMAYAAQMGGVCTLIGTSSNLLTDSLAQQHGLAGFGVFEFTRLGALLAVVGITYLMLVGRWLLPAPGSRFIGQNLKALDFHWHYNATVLAIHRRGQVLRDKLRDVALSVGDILLMVTSRDEMQALRDNANVVVINEREEGSAIRRRAPLALAIMVSVIVASALGLMPIVISALIGGVAMVLTRCLSPEDAYSAIDWRVIVLIAGVLPLGIALQNSGAAAFLADNTLGRVGEFGPFVVLAVLYLLALVLSEMMSNAAAAVLLVPIAWSTATGLGYSPTPFLIAVTFAASTSFSTPVGYQTNTMVYNLGNYRFTDFMKIGIPLNVLFWLIGVTLIPLLWPFTP
jgi:di/tricarboxylate transporter